MNREWPKKTREVHSHHFDSTVWNSYKFRDDDIVISTYAKSGTTWMQQIVCQLLFDGQEGLPVGELSPWIDLRVPPIEVKLPALEAQEHRRFVKTHLPVDALVFSPQAKYVYIARDGRDVLWSLYNHHVNANEKWYGILNDTPGRVGPPMGQPADTVEEYFDIWLEQDGFPFWSLWENVSSWWAIRDLPNVHLVHFANLKTDLRGEIATLAQFLEISVTDAHLGIVTEHSTFDYMKEHAQLMAPLGGSVWHGGARTFIHKGTNGRWIDVLSTEQISRYETAARENLGETCAHWLSTGQMV